DIIAPGCDILSANGDTPCGARTLTGTSMATPLVAGVAALTRQYFTSGYYPNGEPTTQHGFVPTGALLKAMLLNATKDMTGISGYPNNTEGWGRLRANDSLYFAGDARKLIVDDVRHASGLTTGQSQTRHFRVNSANEALRVTLVFMDAAAPAGATSAAVNDLNLRVITPTGETLRGNNLEIGVSVPGGSPDPINNVEQIRVLGPQPGDYKVIVDGAAVNDANPQGFAVVITGDVASQVQVLSAPLATEPAGYAPPIVVSAPEDSSSILRFRRSNQAQFESLPLLPVADGLFSAQLPPLACADRMEYYVETTIASGDTILTPEQGVEIVEVGATVARSTDADIAAWLNAGTTEEWQIVSLPTASPLNFSATTADAAALAISGESFYNARLRSPLVTAGDHAFVSFDVRVDEIQDGAEIQLEHRAELSGWQPVTTFTEPTAGWQRFDLLTPTSQIDVYRIRFRASGGIVAAVDNLDIRSAACTCRADVDGDGTVTVSDFSGFVAGFYSGDANSDQDVNGIFDIDDFTAFLDGAFGFCE
ncbi:MAG: S8 family serine peptidase, partial [Planctomycetota bacterium]